MLIVCSDSDETTCVYEVLISFIAVYEGTNPGRYTAAKLCDTALRLSFLGAKPHFLFLPPVQQLNVTTRTDSSMILDPI